MSDLDGSLTIVAKLFITEWASGMSRNQKSAVSMLAKNLTAYLGKPEMTRKEAEMLYKIFQSEELRRRMNGDLRTMEPTIADPMVQNIFIEKVIEPAIRAVTVATVAVDEEDKKKK